jgi:hypothetical protein
VDRQVVILQLVSAYEEYIGLLTDRERFLASWRPWMFWKAFNAIFEIIAKLVRKRERE